VHESFILQEKISVSKLLEITKLSAEEFKTYNLDMKAAISKKSHLPAGLEVHLPIHVKKRMLKHFAKARFDSAGL
jgi:hypothetical protein